MDPARSVGGSVRKANRDVEESASVKVKNALTTFLTRLNKASRPYSSSSLVITWVAPSTLQKLLGKKPTRTVRIPTPMFLLSSELQSLLDANSDNFH